MENKGWTSGLVPRGDYYVGVVEDCEAVLDKHRIETVTTGYGIRKSRKIECSGSKENALKVRSWYCIAI